MSFVNENTFENFLKKGQESIFHEKFENALENIKAEFGGDYSSIINGQKVKITGKRYKHTSPINKRLILGYIQTADKKQINIAIDFAFEAFKNWSQKSYNERVKIFRRVANTIRKRKFELAVLLSYENGKNRLEAIADIDEAIDFVVYYCMEMIQNRGFTRINTVTSKKEQNVSIMKPYGVWTIISPFNFPAAILVGMSVGALITGNTIVIKPSSCTPIIGHKIVEIMIKSGVPNGVINYVLSSGSEFGNIIVRNKKIAGIVFTGSKEIGYEILQESSKITPRPIIAELGGKNPVIVAESADLNRAVEGVIKASFSYGGQKCSACSRVYVHTDIKDKFIRALSEKTKKINVGNPLEKKNDIGPLINLESVNKFKKYIKKATRDGKILTGGRVLDNNDLKYGFYAEPTIVYGLPKDHILFKNELFLPLVCITDYVKFQDAIKLCNESQYGLTAGIYSNNKDEIDEFLKKIESGVVYINRSKSATTGAMVGNQSFGGWKGSGTTGKGSGGKYYLTQFMKEQSQTIVVD